MLADRGFNITDSVGITCLHQMKSSADSIGSGEYQFNRQRSNSCGTSDWDSQAKYTMLQGTLPIDYVSTRAGEECLVLDRIVRISCALCNLCDSVVPFDKQIKQAIMIHTCNAAPIAISVHIIPRSYVCTRPHALSVD